MGHGEIGFMEHIGGVQKVAQIKLIPIFLSSFFRTVVTTFEKKNGSWSNWIYNVNMHMDHPGGLQIRCKNKTYPNISQFFF